MTVSVSMLPEVTRRIRPPRALAVPFPLGYPLGAPLEPERQREILRFLLALCASTDVPLLAAMPASAWVSPVAGDAGDD